MGLILSCSLLVQRGCALLHAWLLARGVMWVQSSRLFTGLCHDPAGGVGMVVDNLSLVWVHSSYVTALQRAR